MVTVPARPHRTRPSETPLPSGEEGFTLVELVVTLTLIAVGIFGLMGLFLATMTASAGADARTSAQALATREIEALRAIPYDDLDPTATLLDVDAVAKGRAFTITRAVQLGESGGFADAFKRLTVTVTWEEQGAARSLTQDAGVYPSGLDPRPSASPTTSSTVAAPAVPATPTAVTATVNAVSPASQIDLSWSGPLATGGVWEVQRSSNGGATWATEATSVPAGTTVHAAIGLSAGTTYDFRVRAVLGGAPSAWSTKGTASTAAAAGSCTYGTATATPSSVSREPSGKLEVSVNLVVNTGGVCGDLDAIIPLKNSKARVPLVRVGSTYSYLIPAGSSSWMFDTGNHKIEVVEKVGSLERAQIALLVEK